MARLSTQLLISLIIFVFPAFPLDSTWVPRQTPYLNNITIRVILRLSHLVVSVAVAVVFTPYTISVAAEQKFTPATPVTLVILMLLQAAFWAVIGLPVGIKTWRYRFWHWRSRALLVAGFWLLARAAGTFPIPQTYHPICHVVPNHEEGEEEKETPNNASEMVGPLAKMFAEQKEEEEASQEISSQDTNAPEKREEPIIPRPTFIGIKRSHPKMSIHPWIKYWAVTVQIQRDKSKETSRFRLVNVLSSSSRYIFALLFWVWVAVTSVLSLALEIFAFSQGTQNGRLELCVNKWLCYFQLFRPLLGILWAFVVTPQLVRTRTRLIYEPNSLWERGIRFALLVGIPLLASQLLWISLTGIGSEPYIDPNSPLYDTILLRARIVAIVIPGFASIFLIPMGGFLAYSL